MIVVTIITANFRGIPYGRDMLFAYQDAITPDKQQLLIEYDHIFKFFPYAILITDISNNIVYANATWEQQTGYKLREVKGHNPCFLNRGDTPKQIYRALWKTLQKNRSFCTETFVNTHKSGYKFNIHTTIFPVQKHNHLLFYVQISEDITNRKRLEDLKSEFVSTVTHELKTPITSISLLIQRLVKNMRNQKFSAAQIHEGEIIQRELHRLTTIVNDLSDVSRIDTGKLRMSMTLVNLQDIINDTVIQMNVLDKNHHIITPLLTPLQVIADAGRIKQVVINLLRNAQKYSFPHTDIVLSVSENERTVKITVENEGPGIPKENIPFVFDRFYQLHTYKNAGVGLGLYIAKVIIKAHQGTIHVRSTEGKKTTFWFTLKKG